MELTDWEGTILPSMVSQGDTASGFWSGSTAPWISMGRITAVYPPSDSRNISKLFFEYDVAIDRWGPGGVSTRTIIPHCKVMNLFGGVADYETWTPRNEGETDFSEEVGLGPQVLIACPNMSAREGVIIGGVPHTLQPQASPEEGHVWRRRFNGAEMAVNKDGEFSITFSGATDAKGDLAAGVSAANSGSQIILTKDGSVKLKTKDDQQFVHIDHAQKKLSIKADSSWEVDVAGPWSVNALGGVTHETKTAGYTVNAPVGLIHLNAAIGTKLGVGTDAMLKGTTYRAAETLMNTSRVAGFSALAGQVAAAGGALTAAATILQAVSVLHKIPVAGAVIGSVPLQAAAAALTAAGGVLTALGPVLASTLVVPLTAFETGAPTYLSLKNTLD